MKRVADRAIRCAFAVLLGCAVALACACTQGASGGASSLPAGGAGSASSQLAVNDRPSGIAGSQGMSEAMSSDADAPASSVDAAASGVSGSVASDVLGQDGSDADWEVAYPTGWLVVPAAGVDAAVPVRVLSLPDVHVAAHRGGAEVSAEEQERLAAPLPSVQAGEAVIERDGVLAAVDAGLLLVNLPDVLPDAVYDVVYSYAATSNCAGVAIPGVTGARIEGYVDGKQPSAYWGDDQFVVPCAYRTALKAAAAAEALSAQGYRLLVYDAYRPMTAQWHLSRAFEEAYANSPEIQQAVGSWSLQWYVASGPSGHNYGTDLDVGVCDANGVPLPMPSAFDAFDDSGHLTAYQIAAGDIGPEAYAASVNANEPCLALHRAFVDAGFSELASEWWHFADDATESANRAAVGPGGLDFVATL